MAEQKLDSVLLITVPMLYARTAIVSLYIDLNEWVCELFSLQDSEYINPRAVN